MHTSSKQPIDSREYSKAEAFKGIPNSDAIKNLLFKESDRGAILILVAYLEEILGLLISEVCSSPTSANSLLKHGQPAGAFEGRVLLAEAFGLIHETEVRCLRLVQKVRNKAAHFDRSGRGFDVLFDSAPTIDQVLALTDLLGYIKPERQPAIVRAHFVDACTNLASALIIRVMFARREESAPSIKELADKLMATNNEEALTCKIEFPEGSLVSDIRQHLLSFTAALALGSMNQGTDPAEIKEWFKKEHSQTVKIRFDYDTHGEQDTA